MLPFFPTNILDSLFCSERGSLVNVQWTFSEACLLTKLANRGFTEGSLFNVDFFWKKWKILQYQFFSPLQQASMLVFSNIFEERFHTCDVLNVTLTLLVATKSFKGCYFAMTWLQSGSESTHKHNIFVGKKGNNSNLPYFLRFFVNG